MHLDSLVRPVSSGSDNEDPADIFTASLGGMFPDDAQNMHGDPGGSVIYSSRIFGEIELRLADPVGEDGRRLFAHYLWNSGILVAEIMAEITTESGRAEGGETEGGLYGASGDWRRRYREGKIGMHDWSVRDKTVVELGAGSGLAGIIAGASGASRVVISDYPDAQILEPIARNIENNGRLWASATTGDSGSTMLTSFGPRVSSAGHQWGDLTTEFALDNAHSFDIVIAADTLWVAAQHENLVVSMDHLLAEGEEARVWVVAGFHTGRERVCAFVEEVEKQGKLEVEDAWEVDTDLNEREWRNERSQDVGERKRWMVVARLKRIEREK